MATVKILPVTSFYTSLLSFNYLMKNGNRRRHHNLRLSNCCLCLCLSLSLFPCPSPPLVLSHSLSHSMSLYLSVYVCPSLSLSLSRSSPPFLNPANDIYISETSGINISRFCTVFLSTGTLKFIHHNNDEPFQMFVKGERVRVEVDASKASRLQEGHGGWNKKMKKVTVLLHRMNVSRSHLKST